MGFNDYLGPLVNVEGVTSISTISLVDVDVGSFSFYIYLPTPWVKHIKTTVWRVSSLENPSCSKLYFAPSLAVAIAAALPSPVILAASRPSVSAPRNTLVPSIFYVSPSPALTEPLPFVAGEVRLVLLKVILYCCLALYSCLPPCSLVADHEPCCSNAQTQA